MREYGAGIDPITSGHFPFRDKLCMFIGDYDMYPVKIEVILDFKTDPIFSGGYVARAKLMEKKRCSSQRSKK